jgi:hypothetical protein
LRKSTSHIASSSAITVRGTRLAQLRHLFRESSQRIFLGRHFAKNPLHRTRAQHLRQHSVRELPERLFARTHKRFPFDALRLQHGFEPKLRRIGHRPFDQARGKSRRTHFRRIDRKEIRIERFRGILPRAVNVEPRVCIHFWIRAAFRHALRASFK